MINKILDKHFVWLTKKSTKVGVMFFFVECYLLTFLVYMLGKFAWNLLF